MGTWDTNRDNHVRNQIPLESWMLEFYKAKLFYAIIPNLNINKNQNKITSCKKKNIIVVMLVCN